jgi:mono/diheme cytochrome c family protein
VFHANAGGFVACASCHVEGDDDGRVWSFECSATGARRTQTLQAGLRGTEPLHWAGDEATIDQLMADVFVGRMSGPKLVTDQVNALLTWIDAQPRRPRTLPTNAAAVERGRLLFHDARTACATCHSGARMSNNQTVDVGTGRAFQVPTLIGIATRGPFMHDGCASTLRDRFSPQCGGGDMHGVTSHLSETQIADLVAYLESL